VKHCRRDRNARDESAAARTRKEQHAVEILTSDRRLVTRAVQKQTVVRGVIAAGYLARGLVEVFAR
jgi:hypothetical protein